MTLQPTDISKITLTEAQFCCAVGISRTTAWDLRRKGQLQFCRIGAKILYTQQHVEQFLASHEHYAHIPKGRLRKDKF